MKDAQQAYRTALALTQSLVDSGVHYLVASPGYRNSPLLLAAHRQSGLTVLTAVDERGAAFLALGLSRGGEPAAVLCTSGTAVANYFPAVMEAYHSHCPLVVLTADRPSELVGTGANQCTDQTKIFGHHVRAFFELPADASAEMLAGYSVGKAVALAREPVPGPVHLNIRFREPFLPDAAAVEAVEKPPSTQWKFLPSASGPAKEQWEAIEQIFRAARRPLFLLGPENFSAARLESLQRLSHQTGIPFLAENASGLPFRGGGAEFLNTRVESTLAAMASGALPAPDLLVRWGAPLTGKGLGKLLRNHAIPQILFDHWGEAREPDLHPSICVQGGVEGWISAFQRSSLHLSDTEWRKVLLDFGRQEEARLERHLSTNDWTEWHFHRALGEKIGEASALFLGNSMPIRDFNDAFLSKKLLHVFSNRGLSGIDGLIASAAGVAVASKRETHALLGDLSTLHDLSSLSLLSSLRDRLNFTLWTLNNEGGEIFRIVPTARTAGKQEWFTTPQAYDLSALAKAFQLPFTRISSTADWRGLDPPGGAGARIIEVMVDREINISVRRAFHAP